MVSRGPFVLEVPGRTFRFELRDIGGPFVLGKHSHALAIQPGARSLFWEAYWHWGHQGRQVDDQGRCIFKWETALVQITKQVSRPTAPKMSRARPKLTARVTIRSIPQDAEIFADGKFVGSSPAVLTLPVGKHQFRVALSGHKEWIRELELIPDSELTLAANLVKLAKQTGKP